jgi:hypothetical protein
MDIEINYLQYNKYTPGVGWDSASIKRRTAAAHGSWFEYQEWLFLIAI